VSATLELFHAIGDPASAAARKQVTEKGLLRRLRFRNIVYPEVKKDFEARGGTQLPALWDGSQLIQGGAAVTVALDALASGTAP
jgi:hypothetical protein